MFRAVANNQSIKAIRLPSDKIKKLCSGEDAKQFHDILANNYSVLSFVFEARNGSTSSLLGVTEITNRNLYFKQQKRFKKTKQANHEAIREEGMAITM